MALATSLPTAILVSANTNVRKWIVYLGNSFAVPYIFTETQKEKVYEYVALTKTLAETTADAASQEGLDSGASASYAASEDNRVIGSYKLTKTISWKPVQTYALYT
jgi:hypothetical protein